MALQEAWAYAIRRQAAAANPALTVRGPAATILLQTHMGYDLTTTDHVLDRPSPRVLGPPPAGALVPYRPLANPIRGPIGSRSEPQIAMSRRRRPCSREPIKGELQSREGNRRERNHADAHAAGRPASPAWHSWPVHW